MIRKRLCVLLFSLLLVIAGSGMVPPPVLAREQILGVHLLSPSEVALTDDLLGASEHRKFVTIPLSLDDLNNRQAWQDFFDASSARNIQPIIRLTTRFESGAWKVPSRRDILAYSQFLSSLTWHSDELRIVLFNEPNHQAEWGNTLNPAEFAQVSSFASDWFHTEQKRYVVLPAGLDLAADGKKGTMEAFAYWKQALAHVPGLLEKFDGWTSHSYPNPAFSSAPKQTDKRSLRGYQHELEFASLYTQKEFPVYITETGWDQRPFSTTKLASYYREAYEKIWKKDDRVVAVTPFIFQGAPGMFSHFSFLDASGKPTKTYEAFRSLTTDKN